MSSKSMTGFGRGEAESGGRIWTVEIRCVNHRYLDLKIKLPKGYAALEDKLRKKVSAVIQRGRVDMAVTVSGDFSDLLEMKANTSLAENYRDALEELSQALDIEDDISLVQLASFPDVLVREQKAEDPGSVWKTVEQALEKALGVCDTMRSEEGEALVKDLLERLEYFSSLIHIIEESIPELLQQRQQNLSERLQKLLDNVQLDPQRLAQEVAILADKTDVTEEIVRLDSHIKQFRAFLESPEATGRKLDFLLQEFLREVNTMASKINDAAIAHHSVELKGELEKMREQVQNIE